MQINLDFIKDEKIGNFSVETLTISPFDAELHNLSCKINKRPEQVVEAGTFKVLKENGDIWMSNTLMEVATHQQAIKKAKGNVLVAGLGLGMFLTAIKDKKEVKKITVIENSQEVIELVGKYYQDEKIQIINEDICDFNTDEKFDLIWLDIWATISRDNLKEMDLLRKKFSKNSKNILCWSEEIFRKELREDV